MDAVIFAADLIQTIDLRNIYEKRLFKFDPLFEILIFVAYTETITALLSKT